MVEKKTTMIIQMTRSLNLTIFSIYILLFLSTCKGPTPEPGDDPLPLAESKLSVKFTDTKLEAKPELSLTNDEVLAISLNIKKGADGSRPVKMAVYVTGNPDRVGTLLLDNIKLKMLDEQTRSLEVSLPAVGTSISRIFYISITDDKGKIIRKAINVLPSVNRQIISWSNITLGVQASTTPSRFSTITGDIYTVCDLDSNITFVDITYATIGSPSIRPTLVSNPRRGALGLGVTISDRVCSNVSTANGTPTFYAPTNTPIDFTNANDFILKNLAIPTTTQDLIIEAGKIYMFQHTRTTRDGKAVTRKGLIKINSISNAVATNGATITQGLVNFDVKIQR
jgi:hypothetical protein